MSAIQWAVLIVAVAAIVAVYLYSRRDRRAMNRWRSDDEPEPLLPPRDQQLDIFGGEFDEFGVGRPRRVAPTADPLTRPAVAAPVDRPGRRVAPSAAVAPASVPAAESPLAPPAQPQVEEKIVALLIAEREGGQIRGDKLHAALRAQKLEFGARQIYHRLHQQAPVFSVASLVKPGHLDPAQSADFSTPGLTLFMVLPGPQRPAVAIRDMLITAGRLAETLDAQVYNANRRPLTPEAGRELQLEVEDWARRNHVG